jgi:hypothetical protein
MENESMSYAAEVIADSTNKWVGNQMRFATREEAASLEQRT